MHKDDALSESVPKFRGIRLLPGESSVSNGQLKCRSKLGSKCLEALF